MRLSDVCKNYFSGLHDVYNYKNNDNKTNALAVLKIISYFTCVIPLAFAGLYAAASLFGRVTIKGRLSSLDKKVITLAKVLEAYDPRFQPTRNKGNLETYSQSEDFQKHAKTARIYYNAEQLSDEDALRVIFEREPTNLAMRPNDYNEEKLNKLFEYKKSVYNEKSAKKADGTLFAELPNTATVYSETYLWYPLGGETKKEIACLSLPAPALDSSKQPHYKYYVTDGKLDAEKYEKEMNFLFKAILKAVYDNKKSAFGGQGIKRVVLSRFGQAVFLGALKLPGQKQVAHNCYKRQLTLFLKEIERLNNEEFKDSKVEVVMSELTEPKENDVWHKSMIVGNIVEQAREHDLIINAWDPHSAPGNGNDQDNSFDGWMGRASGILLTQTSWLNKTLRSKASLVRV